MGGLGVNIFVLISGYFMCTQLKVNANRIIQLILDTSVYSVGIYVIAYVLGFPVSVVSIIKAVVPVIYPVWWFVTAYVLLAVTAGFINDFIHALNKERLDAAIVVLAVILSVIPTFLNSDMEDSNYLWFVLLYLIAARIRLYPIDNEFIKKHSLGTGVLLYFLTQLSSLVLSVIGKYLPFVNAHTVYFSKRISLPMLLSAVLIFYGFLNIKVKYSECLNKIASTTFGIYLIHMHPVVQQILWSKIFRNLSFVYKPSMVFHALCSSILVFISCSVLSYIYNNSIGKGTNCVAKKIVDHIGVRHH